MRAKRIYIDKETNPLGTTQVWQGNLFINACIGDYFYLTHGNAGIYLPGQITGPVDHFIDKRERNNEPGWISRPHEIIRKSSLLDRLLTRVLEDGGLQIIILRFGVSRKTVFCCFRNLFLPLTLIYSSLILILNYRSIKKPSTMRVRNYFNKQKINLISFTRNAWLNRITSCFQWPR